MINQAALWVPFVVMFLLPAVAHGAATLPTPQGFVTDTASVIPAEVARGIEARLEELRAKTGTEVAVVTVRSIAPLTVEEYANELFARWGIGQKGKDNGVLILLAVKERKVRIETGYGIEPILPDGKAGAIIREIMLPHFKRGTLGEGLAAGAEAVAEVVAQAEGITLSWSPGPRPPNRSPPLDIAGPLILLAFLGLFWALPFWLARLRHGGFFWGGTPMGWGGGYGSGFGGGGFSGGFGGFGGGGSGGGGASGGW